MTIAGPQVKAARSLLEWTQDTLAGDAITVEYLCGQAVAVGNDDGHTVSRLWGRFQTLFQLSSGQADCGSR